MLGTNPFETDAEYYGNLCRVAQRFYLAGDTLTDTDYRHGNPAELQAVYVYARKAFGAVLDGELRGHTR